jgi:hypothetical protein
MTKVTAPRAFDQLLLLAIMTAVVVVGGCSRRFYRNQADKEVAEILTEKDQYPDWKIQQYHVYPDPRARFADPTNPDRPPMPPDDPAASQQSPHPQNPGKAGVHEMEGQGYLELLASWDDQNRAEAAADPSKASVYTAASGLNPATGTSLVMPLKNGRAGMQRSYLIKMDQAVELSIINSREFQDTCEDLYLTALPVTLQRFAFNPQLFAVAQGIRQYSGAQTPGGLQNNWAVNSNVGVANLFSTGALLLANFANQTVVNFAGAVRGVTSASQINLDLVQPFLRGGGLAVTLENLTQAERNLVYAIRNYARFRKTFYVAIAGGGGGALTGATFQPTNVIASPSFSPAAGLGSSRLVPGVVATATAPLFTTGNPSLQVSPGSAGGFGLQVPLTAPVIGYLSTLLEAAQMQIDKYNIEKLEGFKRLAESYTEIGDLSQLQVDQFDQQLVGARKNLVNDQQDYLMTIDQFKLQLGLPPHLLIELDDEAFRPINRHFQKYEDLFNQYTAASKAALGFAAIDMVPKVRGELRKIFTSSDLTKGTRFAAEISGRWAVWEKLSDDDLKKKLADYANEKRKILDRKADLEVKGATLNPADIQRLERINSDMELGQFEQMMRAYENQTAWKDLKTPEERQRRQQREYAILVQGTSGFVQVMTEARNERVKQLHEEWPKLDPVCVQGKELMHGNLNEALDAASEYALANRLDLMNVRGQVVDAWRQLKIFANALLGTLNVQYHLDSATPALGSNPFAFGGSRGHEQLLLNTALPLVRIDERNQYRASLINYQRSRRILQSAEDEVAFEVRQEVIALRQYQDLYLYQTRLIELAYMVVENSLDVLAAPPPPGQNADPATRAAALAGQLIAAQNALYTAQFNLTTDWITYLNTRDQLYRDLELMPLDARGMWIDNVKSCECPPESSGKPETETGELPAPRPEQPAKPELLPLPKPAQPDKPPEAQGRLPDLVLPMRTELPTPKRPDQDTANPEDALQDRGGRPVSTKGR